MNRHILSTRINAVGVLLACILALGTPAYCQNQTYDQVIPELADESLQLIDEQLENKEAFVEDFQVYKEEADTRLEPSLNALTHIIKDYSEAKGDMQESSQVLYANLRELSRDMYRVKDDYPRFDEVHAILQPLFEKIQVLVEEEFRTQDSAEDTASGPFSGFYRFYNAMERKNPLGLGYFFKLDFLQKKERIQRVKEDVREITEAGYTTTVVNFREVSVYEDGELVSYSLIKNDKLVKEYEKLHDFSFIHGLPERMRADGVDERVVRFIEEYIHLLNFYIHKQYAQARLDVNIDHPQLALPADYAPEDFIPNVTGILLDLQE